MRQKRPEISLLNFQPYGGERGVAGQRECRVVSCGQEGRCMVVKTCSVHIKKLFHFEDRLSAGKVKHPIMLCHVVPVLRDLSKTGKEPRCYLHHAELSTKCLWVGFSA